MKALLLAWLLVGVGGAGGQAGGQAGAAGGQGGDGKDDAVYRRDIERWRQERQSRLQAEDGWLTLAGLFWLGPGRHSFGSDPTNEIVLPPASAPPRVGVFVVDAGQHVQVEISTGVGSAAVAGRPLPSAIRTPLRSDADGAEPDVLTLGSLSMHVIERQGRLAIRLKDRNSKVRTEFKGLHYYPVDPRYRILARFVANTRAVSIVVPNVLGSSEPESSPGHVELEWAGKVLRLDAITESPGDPKLFFIFRDRTAGKTTYGAGRFLYADPPQNGRVVLDFNKAYSPPCAFTPYATCPLPPAQNRLPVAIEAGELSDVAHH